MNKRLAIAALSVGALGLAMSGVNCRSKVDKLSTAEHVLDLFERVWITTRDSLASDQPDLDFLRSVEIVLDGRTSRAVELKYNGANKEQLRAKLDALSAAWTDEMMAMVDQSSFAVHLKSGYTVAHVQAVFAKLDKDFVEIQALLAAGQ